MRGMCLDPMLGLNLEGEPSTCLHEKNMQHDSEKDVIRGGDKKKACRDVCVSAEENRDGKSVEQSNFLSTVAKGHADRSQ